MKHKVMIAKILIVGIFFIGQMSFSQKNEAFVTEYAEDKIMDEKQQDSCKMVKNYPADIKPKRIPPWFVRRFKLSAGLFVPVNDSRIEVGRVDDSFGTIADFEDDLGFHKTSTTFVSNLQWRASRRSRFDLGHFYLDRNATHKLQKTIEFGDHTYPVNSTVNSYFKVNIYLFSYGFAFFLKPKYELGLMIGTHTLATEIGINLMDKTAEADYYDKFDFTAPLPDFGIWGGYAITDKLAINGNLNYLSIKANDFSIVSYNVSVMYQLLADLDIAIGYSGMNFSVDVVKTRLQGYLEWGYNGPSLTASYSFGKKKPFVVQQ